MSVLFFKAFGRSFPMNNQQQGGVLKQDAQEEKGEHARLASFVGAMAIADLVKSTLGPKARKMKRATSPRGRGPP